MHRLCGISAKTDRRFSDSGNGSNKSDREKKQELWLTWNISIENSHFPHRVTHYENIQSKSNFNLKKKIKKITNRGNERTNEDRWKTDGALDWFFSSHWLPIFWLKQKKNVKWNESQKTQGELGSVIMNRKPKPTMTFFCFISIWKIIFFMHFMWIRWNQNQSIFLFFYLFWAIQSRTSRGYYNVYSRVIYMQLYI